MGPATEISGGSAANTMVGVASFGGTAAFIGRVARRPARRRCSRHDLRAAGVTFDVAARGRRAEPTGRCLVIVTPDAERTMNTYLGACGRARPERRRRRARRRRAGARTSRATSGTSPTAKDAFRRAARVAHDAGSRVALTLSDAFCVDRHRAEFLELVEHEVDVLFANEAEITSLYEVDDVRRRAAAGAATTARSPRSPAARRARSIVARRRGARDRRASRSARVVDTTGAGDLYAAGFLYGLTHGYDLGTCGRLGALAAAEVISHLGARPEHVARRAGGARCSTERRWR